MKNHLWVFAAAFGSLVLSTGEGAAFDVFVRIGDPVPGTNLTFAEIGPPVVNGDGALAFNARMEGAGVDTTNEWAVFYYEHAQSNVVRTMVLRGDDDVPNAATQDARFVSAQHALYLGDDGVMYIFGSFMDSRPQIAGQLNGVWRWERAGSGGTLGTTVMNASPILDGTMGIVAQLGFSGTRVAYWGEVNLPNLAGQDILFVDNGSSGPTIVAQQNQPAPGADRLYRGFFGFSVAPGGSWAARTEVRDTVSGKRLKSLIKDGAVLVEEEQGVPLVTGTFTGFDDVMLNARGDTMIVGRLDIGGAASKGIFLHNGASMIRGPVAADPVPGLDGVSFHVDSFNLRTARLGGGGHAAMRAVLAGDTVTTRSDRAIMVAQPTTGDRLIFSVVAREGDPAPGLDGITFADLERFDYNSGGGDSGGSMGFSINDDGDTVFVAQLAGDGVTPFNDISLWLWDNDASELRVLLREGQLIVIDGVTYKLIHFSTILGSGVEDGRRTSLNNSGQLGLSLIYEPIEGGAGPPVGGSFMVEAKDPQPIPIPGGPPIGSGDTSDSDASTGGDTGSPGTGSDTGGSSGSSGGSGGCSTTNDANPPAWLLLFAWVTVIAARRRSAAKDHRV